MFTQPMLWQFDLISAYDVERARALKAAPSRAEISQQVVDALGASLLDGSVRIGVDESFGSQRAIIQFHIGQKLFDWFFNAQTGYRAQFRMGWKYGLAYNAQLVKKLREKLGHHIEADIEVRRLNSAFDDIGCQRVTRSHLLESLAPRLSKVWFCRRLICHEGKVMDLLVDVSGPRLVLDEYGSWAAPFVDESEAWLDLKGAFLTKCGLFQPKDPIQRAKDIQSRGSA